MGWAALALLALGAGALLWRLGVGRSLQTAVAAALVLGAAGYASQARPGLPAADARPAANAGDAVDAGLSDLRLRMFGKYTYAETFFVASDGMIRAGSPGSAVRVLLGGVANAKANAAVWTALGSAFAAHDGGTVSPAARVAFDQAIRLAPLHPGPPFFLGIAYVRSGDFRRARDWWVRALALTPTDAEYRQDIAGRLALLDRLLAMDAAASGTPRP